ncbi:MAG: hypothetical protein OEW18_06445 [Candidatus Aminicenantes bacterium]|nr:hypothetical protein [Candidatus Aminicenantes bacterium]
MKIPASCGNGGKGEKYSLDHIHLAKNYLSFTFRNRNGTVYIVNAALDKDEVVLQIDRNPRVIIWQNVPEPGFEWKERIDERSIEPGEGRT